MLLLYKLSASTLWDNMRLLEYIGGFITEINVIMVLLEHGVAEGII